MGTALIVTRVTPMRRNRSIGWQNTRLLKKKVHCMMRYCPEEKARPPSSLRPVCAWVLFACVVWAQASPSLAQSSTAASGSAAGKAASGKSLVLQASPWLEEELPSAVTQQPTTVILGNRLDGEIDRHVTATGRAEVRQPGNVLKSNTIRYDQAGNTVTATGQVQLNRQGDIFRGDKLQLQMDSYEGSFSNVRFDILRTEGVGTASKIDFIDREHSTIYDAVYSSCSPEEVGQLEDWNPAWYIKGKKIILDTEQDEGYVQQGTLVFGGVSILPVSSFSFPLSGQRRSGLLAPTFSLSSGRGVEYSQPYYFNIAPNRDATVATNISSKRGIDLYGQFRYLEERYRGQLDVNVMPNDRLTGTKRWSYGFQHDQTWSTSRLGTFGLSLDLNRVSDGDYWRDFGSFTGRRSGKRTSDHLVPSTGMVSWSRGNWLAFLREQRWQTLQWTDTDKIVPPFNRSPQLHARYARSNVKGFNVALDFDTTRFRSDPSLTGNPNGERSYVNAQISYPLLWPWGFFTPAVEWNATQYRTDTAMSNGMRRASRVLPTITLDGGLIFERNTRMFGRNVQHTLEPRLFYAYAPYKQQDHLPVYDSAMRDLNLSSIFSSNPFTGYDRISDTNTLTAGVTSRLYDAGSGAELARLTLAQRHHFRPRRVFLNATDATSSRSFNDILAEGSINWNPRWSMQGTLGYDQEANSIVYSRIGMRYAPERFRVLILNASRQTDGYKEVNVGWQWPINDLWGDKGKDMGPGKGQGKGRIYSVGRVHYSLTDRRIVDTLIGFEYDSCCWIGRIAWRRRVTQTSPKVSISNAFMLQLELVGLTRFGSGATQTFREHVPGYTPLRELQLYRPSRFGRYD